jgi:hypothetical protein
MFPSPGGYESSTKAMASAAHTCGKPVVGAEAFTSHRGTTRGGITAGRGWSTFRGASICSNRANLWRMSVTGSVKARP